MVGALVVDDQAPFRRAARSILGATAGFELLGEAISGEQAVTMTLALAPQLVLMDVVMPGIGGIEATRRIRSAAAAPVVVLVSSYPARDLPADVLRCGAAVHVPKELFGRRMLEELWSDHGLSRVPPTGRAVPR